MKLLILLFVALTFVGVASYIYLTPSGGENSILNSLEAVVYKSPTCGCCNLYISYLKGKNIKVKVEDVQDTTAIKEKYNIPGNLQSCHTTVINGYVIEGHIPVEAIEKLLAESPKIKGIAMAGMPSGSPGMPGAKTGPFQIYELTEDGSNPLFTSL